MATLNSSGSPQNPNEQRKTHHCQSDQTPHRVTLDSANFGMRRALSHTTSNALHHFTALEANLGHRTPVILLDYDGTLTPIVRDPNRAVLSQRMRQLLRDLSSIFITGVVSGRSLEKIRQLVDVKGLIYAGSHGFDIEGPNHMRHLVAAEFLEPLRLVRERLEARVQGVPGATVEDNRYSVTVHYRNVESDQIGQVEDMVREELKAFPELRLHDGKMIFELKPNIKWDKGKAVIWLLEALGLTDRDDIFPIYIGDDKTDEDVFEVFADTPQTGMGIAVSDERKWTGARMVLRDPDEVYTFLSRLLDHGLSHGIHREEDSEESDTASSL